jgi:hypothetical protein
MARLYRLLSPGVVFAVLGVIVLVAGEWAWFQMRGGLLTTGGYVLALQIVLSALLSSSIDDLSPGSFTLPVHRIGRGSGELIAISTRPISFSRALLDFYRRPFWPVLLLGFGVGASLSALAYGFFLWTGRTDVPPLRTLGTNRSEVAIGTLLLLGAAILWRQGDRSYYGWVIGVTVAAVIGQYRFVPTTNIGGTLAGWGGLAIGLCLLRLLVSLAVHRRRPVGASSST